MKQVQKKYVTALLLFGFQTTAFADIILHGNQNINSPVTYDNETLNLTDGRFTVNPGGALSITNSTVNITISPANPFFVSLMSGSVKLMNTKVNVKTSGIPQNGDVKAAYKFFDVTQGAVSLDNNSFKINNPYTVSFFETKGTVTNTGYKINDNIIANFHGGLYLNNINEAEVNNNYFTNVSFANIFNSGDLSKFTNNIMSFPGNFKTGNAFDIINADGITISNNMINSGVNYGISITGGTNIFIDNNQITDCKSYAIYINTPTLKTMQKNQYLSALMPAFKKLQENTNIVISNNYLAQNKYGLAAGDVNTLIVTNNIFIQKFSDTSIRQFWTNNDNLLPTVDNLIWSDNVYKEAFTQENGGDNTPALQFVSFPAHGGVVID